MALRCVRYVVWGLAMLVITSMALDRLYPLPTARLKQYTAVVTAGEEPIAAFPDQRGVWRYEISLHDVSPHYIEALFGYEDRWFYYHPGINPIALMRAAWQNVTSGKRISGGSTLTMQVARILDPHSRTLLGKTQQMLRALQLEWHFSKAEILTIYLNHAPFGGPIEGVQAASFRYLGKAASELTHAEAALLAILPQAPSRLRPDRHAQQALAARDKLLKRMALQGIWKQDIVTEALDEPYQLKSRTPTNVAPHLARRLKKAYPTQAVIRSTLDLELQHAVNDLVADYRSRLPERNSIAVMVIHNETLETRAYVGSADFNDAQRFGHVDMVQAKRSPGSTLKPFLYGFALDDGLIHSESLLTDAPTTFQQYRPGNFTGGFSGPVSATEALQRSLNVPAVQILEHFGAAHFDARLRQAGINLQYPAHEKPGLPIILGGVATSLESLVGAYRGFANQGLSGTPRFAITEPQHQRYFMSKGAAYIVSEILGDAVRSEIASTLRHQASRTQLAWKTGTSYGFRDAWAIGTRLDYTLGVWVGRPDNTPSPGFFGASIAAPLMFSIADQLPRLTRTASIPASVSRQRICWPLGTQAAQDNDPLCHESRMAWVLENQIPPTLNDPRDQTWLANPRTVTLNPNTGLQIDSHCPTLPRTRRQIARWPRALAPFLTASQRARSRLPNWDPACQTSTRLTSPENLRITSLEDRSILRPPGAFTELPTVQLSASGGQGDLFWLLNGQLIHHGPSLQAFPYQFNRTGDYQITVMDDAGNYDSIDITVAHPRS